jgi:hypothetical protein
MLNSIELTVSSLLAGKLPQELNDKVFWFADRVQMINDVVQIEINNNQGITAFDPICQELNVACLESLAQLKPDINWINGFGPVLVSSGSFLFINGKLAITRRSTDAKVDPNLWTTPAGRCDRTPLETALKETVEEIKIYDEEGNWLIPAPAAPFLASSHRFTTFPTIENHKNKNFPIKLHVVNCYLDGQCIASGRMWFYYSQSVNTLELRLPLFTKIEGSFLLHNEEYRTETKLLSLAEINGEEAVPALKELLGEIYD